MAIGIYAAYEAMDAPLMEHFESIAAGGHELIGLLVPRISAVHLLAILRPHEKAVQ